MPATHCASGSASSALVVILLAIVFVRVDLAVLEQSEAVLGGALVLGDGNFLLFLQVVVILHAAEARLHRQLRHQLDSVGMHFQRVDEAGQIL